MASACALAIFSGKNIYNFAILENLRIFQNRLFTGGVVTASGSCSAAFCESAALRGRTLSGSLRSLAPPKGELLAIWRSALIKLPLSGELARRKP